MQLERLNSVVEQALQRELTKPIDLDHNDRLLFEVDGLYYGISLVQTEEAILPTAWEVIDEGIPIHEQEAAEQSGIHISELIHQEFFPWFADRWDRVDGPKQYHPAYAFYHGGLYTPRYDLEQRRWFTIEDLFGK
jgi:hypothetical protein